MTRAVITTRRRRGLWASLGEKEIPQHFYTPREARRIVGRKRVTCPGILVRTATDTLKEAVE